MADNELAKILAAMAREQAINRQPNFQQVSGLSQAILASVPPQNPYQSGTPTSSDPRGPSFVNRILDIMSRPLYGSMNYVKGQLDRNKGKSFGEGLTNNLRMLSPLTNPEGLSDIWAGLSGKEKTTGQDLIKAGEEQAGGELPGPARAVLGFGLDVAADPLTYVGGIGLPGKLGKAAKTSTEALRGLEEGTQKTAQSLAEQISQKAAEKAHTLDVKIPTEGLPAPKITDPPRIFVAGPGPNIKNTIDPLSAPESIGVGEGTGSLPFTRVGAPQADTGASVSGPQLMHGMGKTDRAKLNKIIQESTSKTSKPYDPEDIIGYEKFIEEPPKPGTRFADDVKTSKAMKQITAGPIKVDNIEQLKDLYRRMTSTTNPVAKNVLMKQIEKVQGGVQPADILSMARVAPPPFPALTINERWINSAREAAQKFLKNNRMSNINPVGQTNLYNSIVNAASKVRGDRRQYHVLQMLRIAEEEILKAGRHLVDGEGISVRLSDLANMSGGSRVLTPKLLDDFRRARPSQQVENLKAWTTPQVASDILDPVVETAAKIAEPLKELPPSQTVMMGSDISNELRKIAERAGASSREATTAKQFIDDLFSIKRDPLYSTIEQQARNLVRQSSTGIMDSQTLHKISQDVYKALGANPKVLGRELQQGKVVEGIMTKLATWWGAKDLQPFSREYIDTARNVASAFAETLTPIVKRTTPTQRLTAWSVATGKMTAGSPEELALANQFKYMVERLLGTHGITNNAESVLFRSGTTMEDLNKEMPKALKFTESKGTDQLGRKFDYTNGNWMHSWKEWQTKEPAETLYQLTRALQMATRKNSMWDDAAIRWGMPVKGAEFQHQVEGINRLKGTYFPQQIADQLNMLQRHLERDVFKVPHKSVELFDKVQRVWKTGVTVYSPSHHIRNLNGDIYLAALDGVVSPRPYSIATKVLHAFPTRYKDLESVFNIMDPRLRDSALRARPGNVVLTTKRGERLTAEQLYQAAESQGLFIRAMHVEDLMGEGASAYGTFGPKFQPFGGKVYGVATRASELRDHWVRLAHFTDVLSKSNQPLRVAIEQAGRRVKKFHPDGMDLTGFEQNVLRRIIPFYSWMRKATPLVIEGAIMRPHVTLAFPKAMANMQAITGIESQGPGDPFPMDQMFPDWIKEKGIGPVLQPGSGLGRDETWRGESPGYTIVNPSNPFLDQLAQIGSPEKTLLSSLSPAGRIPIELLTGQTSLGIPLENSEGGVPGYLAQQIPAVGIGARITGATRDNESYNPEQLINWLSGAGVTGTGPYQYQGQTEIRKLLEQMAKQNRGDYR